MIKFFISLIFLSNLSSKTFNELNKEEISWSKNYKLKWEDFHASIPANSKFAAISNVGIKVNFKVKSQIKKVTTECVFFKDKSWVRDKTETGLWHEQLHFDIGEVCRRIVQNRIDSVIKTEYSISEYNLKKIFSEGVKMHEEMQKLYDDETEHSRRTFMQIQWNNKVDSLLNINR